MKILVNTLLVIVSIIITLICAEVGFRVVGHLSDLKTLDEMNQAIVTPPHGARVKFEQMIQVSKNSRIIYELIPNLSVNYRGAFTNINAAGFRGTTIPIRKSPGTTRVVGLGDSIMFGWGVRDNEGYIAILDKLMREREAPCPWEFVNTAVPGHNTVMEVETLKEKGLAYGPDLVIINFVGNDYHLPNFIRQQENYYSLKESIMVKYFRNSLQNVSIVHAPVNDKGNSFESVPHKVPSIYRDMVGKDAYRRAMEELHALALKHGFDVLVFSEKLLPEFVQEICERLGFGMVEVLPVWKNYAKNIGLDEVKNWRLRKGDPHPSRIAHRVIASTLFDYIRDNYPSCY